MAVRHGYGKIAGADALVFAYDTGDTRNSYKGEPTVNMLYSAGGYNFTNGGNDLYGRASKTNLGGGKYRYVNNGAGISTIRLYVNQPDLIDGQTYAVSVYFEDLIGSLNIDWCDQTVVGTSSSSNSSGRLGGYSSRSSYASPYYFFDITISTNGSVTLFNPQVEYKSHVTPFVAGTRSATQGLLDLTGNNTIDLNTVSFDSNAQMTFDGTDDKAEVLNFPHIWNGSVTMEAIVSWNDDSRSIIFGNYNVGANDINFEKLEGRRMRFYWNRGERDVTTGNNVVTTTGDYHHITMVRDKAANVFRLYVNGVLLNTISNVGTDVTSTGSTFRIGGDTRDGATIHNGNIPVVKLYNRALTTAEVKNNYSNYKGRFNI